MEKHKSFRVRNDNVLMSPRTIALCVFIAGTFATILVAFYAIYAR